MKTVLIVEASARKFVEGEARHQSISKMLGNIFIKTFNGAYSEVEVIYRDLGNTPPSFIDQEFIAASFTQETLTVQQKAALAESDQLISEVIKADVIVITSPMYNYGMPAMLKAWFDQVIRINKTFSFDLARGDEPLQPLLHGKSVVLLASWGEFDFKKGEAKHHLNHLSSHVELLSPYLGADKFYEIASQYQEFGDERHRISKAKAIKDTESLARALAVA